MPQHVAVVGAGIVGLCIAWHLRKRGAAVTLIDPGLPGSGCSSGNAGALSSGSVAPLAMPGLLRSVPGMLLDSTGPLHIPLRYWGRALPWLVRFVRTATPERVSGSAQSLSQLLHSSVERHREILDELGAGDLIRADGQLYVYRDEAQLAKDDATWALRRRFGARAEVLDRAGINALETGISEVYRIGVFLPDHGMSRNPQRQAEVIAAGLSARGVRFLRQAATGLETDGSRVRGVHTGAGVVDADGVVIAAGAWSAALLRPLGYRIPLESQRGYHLQFPSVSFAPTRPVIPADRKVFISPMETGLRVAGTVEFGGLAAPANDWRARLLQRDLATVFPQAAELRAESEWMGHRPCLPDSLPVIGPSQRWQGLWFGFGHGHLGLTGSAPTGEALARVMMRDGANLDLSPFAAERFTDRRSR